MYIKFTFHYLNNVDKSTSKCIITLELVEQLPKGVEENIPNDFVNRKYRRIFNVYVNCQEVDLATIKSTLAKLKAIYTNLATLVSECKKLNLPPCIDQENTVEFYHLVGDVGDDFELVVARFKYLLSQAQAGAIFSSNNTSSISELPKIEKISAEIDELIGLLLNYNSDPAVQPVVSKPSEVPMSEVKDTLTQENVNAVPPQPSADMRIRKLIELINLYIRLQQNKLTEAGSEMPNEVIVLFKNKINSLDLKKVTIFFEMLILVSNVRTQLNDLIDPILSEKSRASSDPIITRKHLVPYFCDVGFADAIPKDANSQPEPQATNAMQELASSVASQTVSILPRSPIGVPLHVMATASNLGETAVNQVLESVQSATTSVMLSQSYGNSGTANAADNSTASAVDGQIPEQKALPKFGCS